MKIAARQIEGFLARPPADCVAALFYGPDAGLAAHRAQRLADGVADAQDPFAVTDLEPDIARKRPGALLDEALAIAPLGGRRLVRLRGAGDGQTKAVSALLAHGPIAAMVVVEAGELPTSSSLRKLFERDRRAAALPCYREEGRDLARSAAALLRDAGVALEPEALDWLVGHLGADHGATRMEVEKLAIYGEGRGEALGLDEVAALIGDGAALGVEEAARAAFLGDQAAASRALEKALAAGENPVRAARIAQGQALRLLEARAAMEEGASAAAAIDGLRPPVHFRAKAALVRCLERHDAAALMRALALFVEAEIGAKTTGWPAELIVRRAFHRQAAATPGRS